MYYIYVYIDVYIYIYKEISTSNCQKLKLDNTTKRFIAFSLKLYVDTNFQLLQLSVLS